MNKNLLSSLTSIFFIFFFSCTPYERGEGIEYCSMWNEYEPQAQYLKEMGMLFEEETGSPINFHFMGRDVLTLLQSRFLMKDYPDLVDQDLSELSASFISDNKTSLVESLDDLFYKEKGPEGQNQLIDIFPSSVLDLYSVNGLNYFFPYILISSGFFYNKDIFETLNLSIPSSWEEFKNLNKVFHGNGLDTISLDGTISFYNAYYLYWAITRMGGG